MGKVNWRELVGRGMEEGAAVALARSVNACLANPDPLVAWREICEDTLRPELPLSVHEHIHQTVFSSWDAASGPAPAWVPSVDDIQASNVYALMRSLGLADYRALHLWSVENRDAFWGTMIDRLGIRFRDSHDAVADHTAGAMSPRWLPGARLNIVDTCFAGDPDRTAIVSQKEQGPIQKLSVGELSALVARVAGALVRRGLKPGDGVGIDMPMNVEAVAAYLGVIQAGGVVVSIADSFMPEGIALRLRLGKAKLVFTQDVVARSGGAAPLYEKVVAAGAQRAVVVPADGAVCVELRDGDVSWAEFLDGSVEGETAVRLPDDPINILFSSGTTAEPKAIPWTQTTPIKCAVDAHLHHDIRPGDVLAWPTSLGWMMGPWLIFASLMNGAAMALYCGTPTGPEFARFVQEAGVTMLGVVPSLVSAWKRTGSLRGCDWRGIRLFSSTGECSNARDMFFLMASAGYRPIVEYCGGTEIGGGYITGSPVLPSAPATFNTPALGLDFVILDEAGRPARIGELFLVPPSIGLSSSLLNKDHHEVYFADTPELADGPPLRRHGDQVERLPGGYYRATGRVDDTMNLAGIKVGSAEIERVTGRVKGVKETAAVGVSRKVGATSQLVVFVVAEGDVTRTRAEWMAGMREAVKQEFSSAFRVYDVVVVPALPKTASNKIIRRELRSRYVRDKGWGNG